MRSLTAGCCACFILCALATAEDAPPPQAITWEIVIAEAPDAAAAASAASVLEMEKAGKLTWIARFRLAGLENQPASIKFGELTPVVTGRAISTTGRNFPSYSNMSVGTNVTAVSRVERDGAVVTDLKVQQSAISPSQPPDPADLNATPQGVVTFNVEATVRGKPGEPLLVSGRQIRSSKETSQTWVVLTCSFASGPAAAPGPDAKATGAAEPRQELKSYYLQYAAAPETARLLQEIFAGQPLTIIPDSRLNAVHIQAAPARQAAATAVLTLMDASNPKK